MAMKFEGMSYFIEDIPESESVVERFRDLTSIAHILLRDDSPNDVDNDKVVRYLIYMFSPGSPLRTDIPDYNKRRSFALNKINVHPNEYGEVSEGYASMCMMNEDWIVDRFIAFTRLFRSVAYTKLITAEARIAQLNTFLLTSKIDKSNDDKNLQQGLKAWYDQISEATQEILDGEKSVRLSEEINFRVKAESLGIRPEEYSRFYRDNKIVFPEIIP